ncbi:hypothetical protein COEREDRAFT_78838 [Coemansia reversa NRRL 1564]|uniref:Uncharacterized protein n=1 Tax=Coemansia reversa (strain ATCC 12441 / NRRL 1564) TaxID=763665 RepID=A0A2G5BKK2_COERN|nr:hypothetical protein COEREDRAFT_78838 [Coemansia reversa NRRL 1564]|eukprot:PIA19492.1 hypothetical protein COEREDRAFT_78838 [Coemansia reversa NRRL 1564]
MAVECSSTLQCYVQCCGLHGFPAPWQSGAPVGAKVGAHDVASSNVHGAHGPCCHGSRNLVFAHIVNKLGRIDIETAVVVSRLRRNLTRFLEKHHRPKYEKMVVDRNAKAASA